MENWQAAYAFRETTKLSKFLKIAIPVQIVLSAITAASVCVTYPDAARILEKGDAIGFADMMRLHEISGLLQTTGIISLISGIIVGISTLVWIYHKHANIAAMRVPGQAFRPGKIVVMWIVPFISAITSYFALNELCRGSNAPENMDAGEKGKNFWGFWLSFAGAYIAQLATYFMDDFPAIEAFAASTLSMILGIVSLYFLRRIILEIDKAQLSAFMDFSRRQREARGEA